MRRSAGYRRAAVGPGTRCGAIRDDAGVRAVADGPSLQELVAALVLADRPPSAAVSFVLSDDSTVRLWLMGLTHERDDGRVAVHGTALGPAGSAGGGDGGWVTLVYEPGTRRGIERSVFDHVVCGWCGDLRSCPCEGSQRCCACEGTGRFREGSSWPVRSPPRFRVHGPAAAGLGEAFAQRTSTELRWEDPDTGQVTAPLALRLRSIARAMGTHGGHLDDFSFLGDVEHSAPVGRVLAVGTAHGVLHAAAGGRGSSGWMEPADMWPPLDGSCACCEGSGACPCGGLSELCPMCGL